MKVWPIALLVLAGCTAVQKKPSSVVTPAVAPPVGPVVKLESAQFPALTDDGDRDSLRRAANQSLAYYRQRPATETYRVGTATYTAKEMADSVELFVQLMDSYTVTAEWRRAIVDNFDIYQSVGADADRTVTFSSYYEPSYPARLKRTSVYRYPYYGRPTDLISVDLGRFDSNWQGGRLSGRVQGRSLVPYYSRTEIDSHHAIRGKAKPIAWAKTPTDIFFLQIEGSGWLDLGGGKKVRIRYDGDNGRKYRSAGQYVINTGRIPKETFHHDTFEAYLNNHPKERQSILNINDRYVFFHLDHSTMSAYAYGNLEVPLTPWRSVALDPKVFPKGGLFWMMTDQPVLNDDNVVVSTAPLGRFILSQDEGGAIQGPHRVDYFVGSGPDAHRFATRFWRKGTLYLLVKKRGI
jgi:membrane-bound lytic murein transglycosylase A